MKNKEFNDTLKRIGDAIIDAAGDLEERTRVIFVEVGLVTVRVELRPRKTKYLEELARQTVEKRPITPVEERWANEFMALRDKHG